MLLSLIFIFAFGACIGSFLNVVILRGQSGKTLGGRSECPNCKHPLSSTDLVPILSFVFLAGKCRYCGHKLSWQYPAVESAAAFSFALLYYFWLDQVASLGFISTVALFNLLFALFVTAILIVVSVFDLRWGIIPDKILFPAAIVALCYQLTLALLSRSPVSLLYTLATTFSIGLFFLILILTTRGKGMGGGDFKLSVFLGLSLGFPAAIIGLLLGFLTGAGASVMLLLLGKKGLKSSIAFGPFLAFGAYLALLFGPSLWTAYLKALGF